MQIVDANVLLYAANRDADDHGPARRWLDAALSSSEAIGFPWAVLLAFLRISTSPAASSVPLTVDEATETLEGWLGAPPALVVEPTPRHLAVLHGLLAAVGTGGNLVTDAHLAALAIEHRAQIVSFDHDFARFPGLSWHLPE